MTENPKTLVIVLTEKCNLKCPYCRASGGEGTKKLNFNFIKKAIDYFIEKGYDKPYIRVNFYAKGEPTTEFNLMKTTYKYLQSKTDKIKSSIFTNGVFSKKIAKWLSKNIDMIDMSVDGYPKIQNKQRPLKNGNASSPIVEKNIKYFIRNGNYLRINSVITNFSVHKQSEILKYFYSLGVKKIIFTPVVIEGSCIENNIQYLDRKVFLDNFLKARELAEDFSISLTSGYRLLDRKTKKYCDLGYLFLLLPDNYISTCRAVVSKNAKNAEPFIIGKYDPIKDKIYIDEDKRKKLEKIDLYNFSTCLKCPIKYKCAGGCLRQWKSIEKFFKTNKNSGEVKISGKPDKKVCDIKIDTVEKYKNYRIQRYEKNKIPYLEKKAFGYNYNMFFNKFKLYKTKNNQKISESSFINIEPPKCNLDSLANQIINTNNSTNKIILFIISFSFKESDLNRKNGEKIKKFLSNLLDNKVYFKIVMPLPVCIFSNIVEYNKIIKKYNIPKNYYESLGLFFVRNDNKIEFFNGLISEKKIDKFENRTEIYEEFIKNKRDSYFAICKRCRYLIRRQCEGFNN